MKRKPAARENKHVRGRPHGNKKALGEEELHSHIKNLQEPFLLILDCIQDPHNLGAIMRTAEAAGVDAVIAPKDKAAGITETVSRVSVGSAERVPFFAVTNLARAMRELKKQGVWFVGTSDRAEQSFYEVKLTGSIAIVMGAEEAGMRRMTTELCDFITHLPMKGLVPCLNVSVATGVCLYEAVRQRVTN